MNKRFLESHDIVVGQVPIALGSARTGDTVSMKNWGRCTVVFVGDIGTANEDVTLGLQQCSSVAPSNAKNLTFTRVDTKQGTLSSVGTWTKVTQAAGATYTNTDAGGQQKLWVVEVLVEDLDVDNGFDCLYATTTDAGTAATGLGCLLYILSEPRYGKEGGVSAIVD
jgi:hypothetical protein